MNKIQYINIFGSYGDGAKREGTLVHRVSDLKTGSRKKIRRPKS